VILVDSNILIDVLDHDSVWYNWSVERMDVASRSGRIAINHIIVSEVAPFAGELDEFLAILEPMGIEIENLCNQTAYAAGLAFRSYRSRRTDAAPKSILPDFLIGGHAQTLGATILTRDPRFYRVYFPQVPLITPSKDEE
jgi:predicted nucleic acid-binding protein